MENSFNVKRLLIVGLIVTLLVGFLIFLMNFYIFIYQGASISGKVIDKETGNPIEGVNVSAYWQLYDNSILGGLGGRVPTRVIGVHETITDKDGFYYIPGWDKKIVVGEYMGDESPIIGFYKQGYKLHKESNSIFSRNKKDIPVEEHQKRTVNIIEKRGYFKLYHSMWDNKVIKLKKDGNDGKSIILNLELVDSYIDRILRAEGCQATSINNFINSYTRYAEYIKLKYPNLSSSSTFRTNHYQYDQCGSYDGK